MKLLFEHIKTQINSLVPAVKHVEMWRGQTTRERIDKKENPFRTPAVFVEFITNEVQNLSLGIKNVHMTVRFRFALPGMKFARLDDLDFQDDFDAMIQGLRADAGAGTANFSTLQEVVSDLDEGFDALNEPVMDYTTVWRKATSYKRSTDITHSPVTPSGTGQHL